jgi:hypothetical protein
MPLRSSLRRTAAKLLLPLVCALSVAQTGCPTVDPVVAGRSDMATKWFKRAQMEFERAEVDEAKDSITKALALAPNDVELKTLGAQIHLAMLDYSEAVRLLRDVKGSQASALRGRALWYKGDLDGAADELEAMLNDPDVVDDWAKSIAKLARLGAGRSPFTVSGGLLTAVEMPHVSQIAPFFIVPVEIDGEPALGLVSTGYAEVVLDSATRAEPSWISLRFNGRLEVQDVPALAQDLSGLSKQVGAPIKAILGVNLIRHLNVTIDWQGRQFVARSFSPPPPPDATRVPLYYAKGGGMVMKSSLADNAASLLIDTAMVLPVSLDEGGWKKAGVEVKDLKLVPDDPEKKLKEGQIKLSLGSYQISQVPAYLGDQIKGVEDKLAFNIDGMVGNGLLAYYRMTFGDGGRVLWLEDNLTVQRILNGAQGGQSPKEAPPASSGPQLTPPNESMLPDNTPKIIVPDRPAPGGPSSNPSPAPKGGGGAGSSSNPPPRPQRDSSSKGH